MCVVVSELAVAMELCDDAPVHNLTPWEDAGNDPNSTSGDGSDVRLYQSVYGILYGYGLPTICAAGFLGNVMNLIIMGGKRTQRSLRKTERAANVGLIALAVADMMFCLSAFPSTFLPQNMQFREKGFLVYYGCYCAAVINVFIMTSTWLTVTMATERYLAICQPLKSRNIVSLERTKLVIVLVYFLSAVINVPVFWRYQIEEQTCWRRGINTTTTGDDDNTTMVLETTYSISPQVLYNDERFDHAYRAIWAVVGNFVPLLLLLVFNIALMREIHKSYAMRKRMNGNAGIRSRSAHDAEASNRITVTLVAIVVMFFLLVAPSEILKHVAYLVDGDLQKNYTYLTIEIVTNLMQTINFSANFILYCIINPTFRKSMKEMFCFGYQKLGDGLETSYGVGGGAGGGAGDTERFGSMRMVSFRNGSTRISVAPKSRTPSVRSTRA
jgi:cholecystokinin A receptor